MATAIEKVSENGKDNGAREGTTIGGFCGVGCGMTLKVEDGVFQVRATNGDTPLGGDDIDQLLMRLVLSEIAGRREGWPLPMNVVEAINVVEADLQVGPGSRPEGRFLHSYLQSRYLRFGRRDGRRDGFFFFVVVPGFFFRAFGLTRSGSLARPVSRFHSS